MSNLTVRALRVVLAAMFVGMLLGQVVALPWLAYHFVEEPGIRLGRKLAERVIAGRAPFPAASRQY